MMDNKIYYINNSKKLIFLDNNTIFLKTLISTYKLNGENISLLVKDLVSIFENGCNISEAKEVLSKKYTVKSIEKIIDVLLDKQILTEYESKSLPNDIKFISEFKNDLNQISSLHKDITLGIIASDTMLSDILTILDDISFINNINLLNIDYNSQENNYRIYPNINIKLFNNDNDKNTQIYNLMNESTFTIVSLDEYNDILFEEINNFAIELEKPWLKSVINDINGEIGPLIIPKKTPCYECYKSRLFGNMINDNLITFNQVKRDVYPLKLGYLPSFIKINTGILMTEVIKYFLDMETQLKGGILDINYLTYEISIHPLLKVHSCKCQE